LISSPSPEAVVHEWIRSRASAGVVLAQAVTAVTVDDGRMTIHIDPDGIARSREWPAAVAPFPEGIANFYAAEFGWTNDQAAYLREHITTLEVVDVAGHRVGDPLDTADFRKRKNPDPARPD